MFTRALEETEARTPVNTIVSFVLAEVSITIKPSATDSSKTIRIVVVVLKARHSIVLVTTIEIL